MPLRLIFGVLVMLAAPHSFVSASDSFLIGNIRWAELRDHPGCFAFSQGGQLVHVPQLREVAADAEAERVRRHILANLNTAPLAPPGRAQRGPTRMAPFSFTQEPSAIWLLVYAAAPGACPAQMGPNPTLLLTEFVSRRRTPLVNAVVARGAGSVECIFSWHRPVWCMGLPVPFLQPYGNNRPGS
jgi:hypothetical protein